MVPHAVLCRWAEVVALTLLTACSCSCQHMQRLLKKSTCMCGDTCLSVPGANRMLVRVQVGIIALNLIGEPLRQAPEGPPGFLDTEGPTSHELPYYNRAAGDVADLQLDVHVDSTTAARIKARHQSCFRCLPRSASVVAKHNAGRGGIVTWHPVGRSCRQHHCCTHQSSSSLAVRTAAGSDSNGSRTQCRWCSGA
jgi:hypothetical protein